MKAKLLPSARLVLSGILCLSGSLIANAGAINTPNQRTAPANRQDWRQKKFQDLSTILNLTPGQQTRAKEIFDNAWSQERQIMPQLRQGREQMRSMFLNAAPANFDAQVNQMATRQGQLIANLIEIHTRAMRQFYSLTPEQQTKAMDLYDLMRTDFPFQEGMGEHGGMARGHHQGLSSPTSE